MLDSFYRRRQRYTFELLAPSKGIARNLLYLVPFEPDCLQLFALLKHAVAYLLHIGRYLYGLELFTSLKCPTSDIPQSIGKYNLFKIHPHKSTVFYDSYGITIYGIRYSKGIRR